MAPKSEVIANVMNNTVKKKGPEKKAIAKPIKEIPPVYSAGDSHARDFVN